MEYIPGKKITELSPLRLMEIDGPGLARELFRAYLKQILLDGFVHADPHPGNVFLTDDDQIALLDLGMVARLLPGFRDNVLRLLLAIAEGRGEEAAEVTIRMGEPKPRFDKADFTKRIAELVAENADASLTRNSGKVALEITRISADCWFRLPSEFTMVAKALLNLDRSVFTLDPNFEPTTIIRQRAMEILQRNLMQSMAPGNLLGGVVELKEFVEKLPGRVNKILDTIGNNEFKVDINHAIDEKIVLEGLQKVANRISLGLILAALIVGAAMLMRVETPFKILGYPGFAMIFFLLAAIAGIGLVITIVTTDVKARKKPDE